MAEFAGLSWFICAGVANCSHVGGSVISAGLSDLGSADGSLAG